MNNIITDIVTRFETISKEDKSLSTKDIIAVLFLSWKECGGE